MDINLGTTDTGDLQKGGREGVMFEKVPIGYSAPYLSDRIICTTDLSIMQYNHGTNLCMYFPKIKLQKKLTLMTLTKIIIYFFI